MEGEWKERDDYDDASGCQDSELRREDVESSSGQ